MLSAQNQPFCYTAAGGPGYIGPIPSNVQSNVAPPSGPFYIRVYPHVIRRQDGSLGATDEAVEAAFTRLAIDFSQHNIFFVRACDVIDVPVADEDYLNFGIYCQLWNDPMLQHSDGIDMFFGPEEILSPSAGAGGAGVASGVPGKSLWVSGMYNNGMPAIPTMRSFVMSHEMGHCLGLYHTHHGTVQEIGIDCQGNQYTDPNECCELVNGSNAASCGDYVKDTDADPQSWATYGIPDPCANINIYYNANICNNTSYPPVADINGDAYTPPIDKIMSYSRLTCITGFTPGQGERMRQIISISPILQACLVHPDLVDVTISTNTTWTTANTPNNGDFLIEGDLTILAGATLTIDPSVRVRFGENSRVIIKPNAVVRLSGTLTSMGCSQTWRGVEAWGSAPGNSQYVVNGLRAQGRLEGLSGSVIENAQTAVKLYGPTAAYAGGQINCSGTTFRNNIIGVDFANYANFWPYAVPSGQQGQPRNYFGNFSNCGFVTDDGYPHTEPFKSFIYMSGVNGVRIAGTVFSNDRDISGSSIADWGYGIQAVDAGFTVTATANGIVYPPTSFNFSTFRGLGYAIQSQTSVVNRPYIVRQTNFDRCFVGIRNWAVDGATILFNNFNLGDLPSTVPTSDAVGIIFETDVSGFTCEENDFTRVSGPAGVTTIGSVCINTGDQHKTIRRNTYTGLDIGNLANQQNAFINPPNTQNPTFRGLYYDCNHNFNVTASTGLDFSVPNGIVRPRQGLETQPQPGVVEYRAAGNRFSYTSIDLANFGVGLNYYYFPFGANQPLQTIQGAVNPISGKENYCAQTFCEVPCKTDAELTSIKADYYAKRSSLSALDATIGTSPTDEQKATRAYYQYSMDQNAYMIALHMMYDTMHYDPDTLRAWIANMNSIEGDIWLALDFLAAGVIQRTNAILDGMPVKHALTTEKQADIADVKVIANAIAGQNPYSLDATAFQTIGPIAYGPDGFARSWARRLLNQHGRHFAPEYVKYDKDSGEREMPLIPNAFASEAIKVQPNPARDFVVFELPAMSLNATLRIFDLNGNLVQAYSDIQVKASITWQTGPVPSGIYIYQFVSEGKINAGKILISK